MIKRIDHIAIVVDDIDAALNFWRDTLGLELPPWRWCLSSSRPSPFADWREEGAGEAHHHDLRRGPLPVKRGQASITLLWRNDIDATRRRRPRRVPDR